MSETKPIPVRLGDDLIARLDAAAGKIGNTRAGVIRFLVESWLVDFEKTGKSSLPPNWPQLLAQFDGRTKASKISSGTSVGQDYVLKATKKKLKPGSVEP